MRSRQIFMATDRQVQANRANAKQSSGPKSERGKRVVALNAIKHGLSMPLSSALGQPDGQDHPALQAIAELIDPECTSPEIARRIASTILEFERNEIVQREFFISCCAQQQALPAGAQLVEAVRQRYPEYDMLQDAMYEELLLNARPDRRWIAKGMKVMQKLQQEFIQSRLQEQTGAWIRWGASQRYLKRAANQLAKALRANVRGQP
jgi:hypothetical protein